MALNFILDFFYPRFCLFCRKEGSYPCPDCFSKIKTFESPTCPYCQYRSFDGKICKNHKKYLDGFIAASPYQQEFLVKLIDALKYNFIKEISDILALLILKFLNENKEIEFFKNNYDFVLIPIPLHKKRLHWRGFNQAEEIAKKISPLIKVPIKNNVIFKKKKTKPQVGLAKKERKENIKDAFSIEKNKLKLILTKKIILIDDVATTLSTLEEAAKLLKKNKIKEVWGLTVAHG